MRIYVKHLQKRGKSGWRYRRKVPANLREALGQTEIVTPLGRSEAEALRHYPRAHADAEKELAAAALRLKQRSPDTARMTPLELHRWATQHLRNEWGMEREPTVEELEGDPYGGGRDALSERIFASYRLDEEGHPIGLSTRDEALLRALNTGRHDPRPDPTLEDARRLYLKEKVRNDKKNELQLERVFQFVKDALGRDRKLSSLRREDAKEVRDYMLDGRSASSVDRYLNTLRAVIKHAIKEYDLASRNPFMGLEVGHRDKAEPDKDKRRPFTDKELKATRERILRLAKDDLQHIWRILERPDAALRRWQG